MSFPSNALINGRWVEAADGTRFPVLDPATKKQIATVPEMSPEEVDEAVRCASNAFVGWSKTVASVRAELLRKWYYLILDNLDELAQLLSSEQGKPIKEARGEIEYGASFVLWFSEEAVRVYGDVIPSGGADKRLVVIKQPVGVVAAITPWNFPIAMITRKMAPALAAGCTVVLKPAEDTPLSALALAALAQEAGFPDGVINIVTTSNPGLVGKHLVQHPGVRKVSFTGSTAVGKLLLGYCADSVKRVSLELGGNAPFIVFADADVDQAVAGAIQAKFRNSGQTCVCANRFLVHADIYSSFAKKLTAAVHELTVGAWDEDDSDIGPLINEGAVVKIEHLLEAAHQSGAKIAVGGHRTTTGSTFFEPTIVLDATPEMDLVREEIFGPVATLIPFTTDAEAITVANDTKYGLAAYIYTRDHSRVWHVSEALEYGIVGVNTGLISTASAPFGGVKESGLGREGSRYGVAEYLNIKYICMGGIE